MITAQALRDPSSVVVRVKGGRVERCSAAERDDSIGVVPLTLGTELISLALLLLSNTLCMSFLNEGSTTRFGAQLTFEPSFRVQFCTKSSLE